MNKLYIILGLVMLGIIGFFALSQDNGSTQEADVVSDAEIEAAGDPLDPLLAFYKDYLAAVQDESIDPYQIGVMDNVTLSTDVRSEAEINRDAAIDPILCQSVTPPKIGARPLFVHEADAQIQVFGRGFETKSPEQAVVSLSIVDGAWQITKIECMHGESAPVREFSFDREGYLLKSVPPPLDSQYWHLVFEQNGQNGHTAPLFFDAESVCIDLNGNEAACDESKFMDAEKAHVKGQMTEAGVSVKFVELMEEG